ncbi:MAG: acyltransferase family protein [Cyanobacteria bacterium J06639_16]
MGDTSTTRLIFMDNLRVFLTILVVAHHAAQPYGPTGGEWPIFNPERAAILGPFFAVNAAFFMGLFFFISGYFLPAACDRQGGMRLLQERLRRLGIPVLFFALVIFPPVLYLLASPPTSFLTFFIQRYVKQLEIEVAHLWFLMHLLCYIGVYVLWRYFFQRRRWLKIGSEGRSHLFQPPGHGLIFAYLLGLGGITFGVRIQYPIDRWVNMLGFLPAEIAHFPQYVSLFMLGIIAYRQNWLRQMPTNRGMVWLGIGCSAGLLRYIYSFMRTRLSLPDLIAAGGLDWRALVWSSWEAAICIGLCIGLLTLFRERINFQGKLLRLLSANAYGVYLIHLLMILYIQFVIADLSMGSLAKFGLVMVMGTPLCFALSALLRRLPCIKFVIS